MFSSEFGDDWPKFVGEEVKKFKMAEINIVVLPEHSLTHSHMPENEY